MPEIISQKEAIERGLKRYFTGGPCKRGHLCERAVIGRGCVKCVNDRARAWALLHPDKVLEADRKSKRKNKKTINEKRREKYQKNKMAYALEKRAWRLKNPEKVRLIARRRLKPNAERRAKIADLINVLRTEMPELLKEFDL